MSGKTDFALIIIFVFFIALIVFYFASGEPVEKPTSNFKVRKPKNSKKVRFKTVGERRDIDSYGKITDSEIKINFKEP